MSDRRLYYVYSRITGKLITTARTQAAAIAAMADHVPDMDTARRQFELWRGPKPLTSRQPDTAPRTRMPWGRYYGHDLTCVPWRYLDRLLSAGLDLRDPGLAAAIRHELAQRPDYLRYVQELTADNSGALMPDLSIANHIRDFTPSMARGR